MAKYYEHISPEDRQSWNNNVVNFTNHHQHAGTTIHPLANGTTAGFSQNNFTSAEKKQVNDGYTIVSSVTLVTTYDELDEVENTRLHLDNPITMDAIPTNAKMLIMCLSYSFLHNAMWPYTKHTLAINPNDIIDRTGDDPLRVSFGYDVRYGLDYEFIPITVNHINPDDSLGAVVSGYGARGLAFCTDSSRHILVYGIDYESEALGYPYVSNVEPMSYDVCNAVLSVSMLL